MRRLIMFATVTTMTILGLVGVMGPTQAKVAGPNGRIVFDRWDPSVGSRSTFTVNPDGSHEVRLLAGGGGNPHWSPDGTHVALTDGPGCDKGEDEAACAAVIVDADTGTSRVLPNPDPSAFTVFIGCSLWSPDGTRLACTAGGADGTDVTGIYTIRASDGGGLTRVLSCECGVMDYSPDGKHLLISYPDPTGQVELFVVRLDGTGLHQITPSGTLVDWEDGVASWSPTGNRIVFAANPDTDHRRGIFVVKADGSGFHRVPIPGCGGAFSDPISIGCTYPGWSPDGSRIVFRRNKVSSGNALLAIYTANADGSGLSQVTTGSNLDVGIPDWGPHPLAT